MEYYGGDASEETPSCLNMQIIYSTLLRRPTDDRSMSLSSILELITVLIIDAFREGEREREREREIEEGDR